MKRQPCERAFRIRRTVWITPILLALLSGGVRGEERRGSNRPLPVPITQPADAEVSTLVIQLRHARADDVADTLRQVFEHRYGDAFSFVPRGETGVIVVAGPKERFYEVLEIIKSVDQPPSESRAMRVYRLENADAGGVCDAIRQLIDEGDCGVDERTNSVIVTASSTALLTVEKLIESLDVVESKGPARRGPERSIRVFQLSRLRHDDPMPRMLDYILENRGHWAVDEERKQIIVSADPAAMERAVAFLSMIDSPPDRPAGSESVRVRLVWLISGLELDRQPPEDLAPVVEELGHHGVGGLRLAAQTMVQTMAGEDFRTEASPVLEHRCELELEGEIEGGSPDRPKLQVRLRARQFVPEMDPNNHPTGKTSVEDLCQLETTVVAPHGHAVVLGVTPAGNMTSVFVLQIHPE